METDCFPSTPFTPAQARAAGVSARHLSRAVAEGRLLRPLRGVLVPADRELTVQVRASAARLVVGPSTVLVDRSAAWFWGVDCHWYAEHDGDVALETCVLRGRQATERREVNGVTRDLLPEDWVTVDGVRVTTPVRTAADLGCRLLPHQALGAMDALAREQGFDRRDVLHLLPRYRRRRGVLRLRSVAPLVDPRAESQPESWVRWFIVEDGLPAPEPQVWVVVEGRRVRVDLGYRGSRVLVEFDGEEFHTDPDDRENDEQRRAALRRAGWIVIVVRREGLTVEGRLVWLRELREALRGRGVRV